MQVGKFVTSDWTVIIRSVSRCSLLEALLLLRECFSGQQEIDHFVFIKVFFWSSFHLFASKVQHTLDGLNLGHLNVQVFAQLKKISSRDWHFYFVSLAKNCDLLLHLLMLIAALFWVFLDLLLFSNFVS